MVNKKTDGAPTLKLDDTRLWIVALLVLLAVANTLVFYVYQKVYPTQSLPYQIWNYLKSDPFKAVTISIMLTGSVSGWASKSRLQAGHQPPTNCRTSSWRWGRATKSARVSMRTRAMTRTNKIRTSSDFFKTSLVGFALYHEGQKRRNLTSYE